jgi:uncharacterized protein YecT (DUF1311 family)
MSAITSLLLFALATSPQTRDDEDPCKTYGQGMATIQCDSKKWEVIETSLQSTYTKLVAKVRSESPHLVNDLISAQRSWIRTRDLSCSVFGRWHIEGNTWTAWHEGRCRASEAEARTKFLQSMLLSDEF